MGICDLNTVISCPFPQSVFELAMCVRVGERKLGRHLGLQLAGLELGTTGLSLDPRLHRRCRTPTVQEQQRDPVRLGGPLSYPCPHHLAVRQGDGSAGLPGRGDAPVCRGLALTCAQCACMRVQCAHTPVPCLWEPGCVEQEWLLGRSQAQGVWRRSWWGGGGEGSGCSWGPGSGSRLQAPGCASGVSRTSRARRHLLAAPDECLQALDAACW